MHHLARGNINFGGFVFSGGGPIGAALAGGKLCVGGMLAIRRIFFAAFQRYGNLAVARVQSFYYALTRNPGVAQHKTFAALLLALGAVAALRTSGRLRAAWSALLFPVLALGGAIMLLFHHHGGMHGADAMQTMVRVATSAFAICGGRRWSGGGERRGRYGGNWRPLFDKIWPLLMIALGVLLLLYTE